ncbi:hypothetical protein ASE16_11925 [Leifsonia sp. Root227]|uniref:hypothetical protein n=1 Tax=Leifsonia sp. Root227 TaxID=1736496 RepID=UPI0006F2AFF5|nr:hypothetical protein [Leifsonia sp. Root227]KRC49446.1 hypothetical protein ASE16_11925 [Leifsonia sp. Root227]
MPSNYPDSRKTGQELRIETIAAMEAAIAASGFPDGWGFDLGPDAAQWDPAAEEFIGAGCATRPGNRGQLFQVELFHAPDGDPVAFAMKMGEFWKSRGYTVTAVGDIDRGARHFTELRADRSDGSLYAGVTAHTTAFNLGVYSECTTDPSLEKFAGPNGYRSFDWNDPNPYRPTNTPSITPYPRLTVRGPMAVLVTMSSTAACVNVGVDLERLSRQTDLSR